MKSKFESMLREYQGIPLDLKELSLYDQQALEFFMNEELVDNPFMNFSFNHDISVATENYQKMTLPGSSMTAFMIWCAAKSLCSIRQLSWRKLGDAWYEFKNLPFYMPIATGLESRLVTPLLRNISNS